MYHCKVMIVDGLLVSVGSTNFDYRSFRINDEATLNLLDEDVARAQTQAFEDDMKLSDVVSFEAWYRRPKGEELVERSRRSSDYSSESGMASRRGGDNRDVSVFSSMRTMPLIAKVVDTTFASRVDVRAPP